MPSTESVSQTTAPDEPDDDDTGLPAAICAALLCGLAVGSLAVIWLLAMHRAGQGAMP